MERSDTVLWTIAPPGVVLHNFRRRRFLELDEIGYKAWGFLDGARTIDEVIARCCALDGDVTSARNERRLRRIIETLAAHGFVTERDAPA